METMEIEKKLINEINLSKNKNLLEEFYRFLNLENETNHIQIKQGTKFCGGRGSGTN